MDRGPGHDRIRGQRAPGAVRAAHAGDKADRRFTHTPAKGQLRAPEAAAKEYEQAVRQSWRALALVVKAKLEAVEAGIVGFEEEFFAHLVLPNGKTVFEEAGAAVAKAYETGQVKPLLQLGP
ncbi:hypothetical protein [Paenarthrobacter nicotinovorans]|uniref:hypothetical protein n=1 Tax=Paenarthrobacter nicotinovorans TaxID=29320 RepID=UPI0021B3135F|nr:hypothetical protein [Paenarthrobacter nicotinovorans]